MVEGAVAGAAGASGNATGVNPVRPEGRATRVGHNSAARKRGVGGEEGGKGGGGVGVAARGGKCGDDASDAEID